MFVERSFLSNLPPFHRNLHLRFYSLAVHDYLGEFNEGTHEDNLMVF